MITTGEVLKKIMMEKGLRQVDIVNRCQPFCEKYGVKIRREDISQYIAGKSNPNQYRLSMLAKALNVNEAYLMGYDVPPTPNRSALEDRYLELNEENRKQVDDMIDFLISRQEAVKKNENA